MFETRSNSVYCIASHSIWAVCDNRCKCLILSPTKESILRARLVIIWLHECFVNRTGDFQWINIMLSDDNNCRSIIDNHWSSWSSWGFGVAWGAMDDTWRTSSLRWGQPRSINSWDSSGIASVRCRKRLLLRQSRAQLAISLRASTGWRSYASNSLFFERSNSSGEAIPPSIPVQFGKWSSSSYDACVGRSTVGYQYSWSRFSRGDASASWESFSWEVHSHSSGSLFWHPPSLGYLCEAEETALGSMVRLPVFRDEVQLVVANETTER